MTDFLDPVKNFAESEVATAPTPADSGTTLSLTGGDGSKFPNPSSEGEFNITVFPSGEQPTTSNAEIMRVTARSGDDLTVDRAQEGTGARTVVVTDIVHLGPTEKTIEDIDGLFNTTTGHEHDGADSKQVDHTNLTSIGTNTHDQIDTHIAGGIDEHALTGVPWDGWVTVTDTWTYASATTITVPSGAASIYQKGDKIKLTQTGVKYFYITDVADTLLTVTGGSDYTVANAAITSPAYSKVENPQGFPQWFNFTPTWYALTLGSSINTGRFKISGQEVSVRTFLDTATGFSQGTKPHYKLPVPSYFSVSSDNHSEWDPIGEARLNDSGSSSWLGTCGWAASNDSCLVAVQSNLSGDDRALNVDATSPFSWSTGSDEIITRISYRMA